jgi:hypothetical protein
MNAARATEHQSTLFKLWVSALTYLLGGPLLHSMQLGHMSICFTSTIFGVGLSFQSHGSLGHKPFSLFGRSLTELGLKVSELLVPYALQDSPDGQ